MSAIATAKAVRTLCEAHLPLHPEDNQIELVVYEFDSSTMTSFASSTPIWGVSINGTENRDKKIESKN